MQILHTILYTFPMVLHEDFFNNQVPHGFVIISFILLTLLFDSGVILLGESRFLSLWGVKGFIRKFVAAKRKVVNQILRV